MRFRILLFLAFSLTASTLFAQDKKLIQSYKDRESGVMLFPNKVFAMWTYMTIVQGYYQELPDGLFLLKPKKEPLFEVYGAWNDAVEKDKVRIHFENFSEGKNYIQFEKGKTYSVFNDHPNCLTYPYIHTFDKAEVGDSISLIHAIGYYDDTVSFFFEGAGIKNKQQFALGKYNDFLISFQGLDRNRADAVLIPMDLEGKAGVFFHKGRFVEENIKTVREELKKMPQERLKSYFMYKENPEDIDDEGIVMLYKEILVPPVALIVERESDEVVASSPTAAPSLIAPLVLFLIGASYTQYLQVKTQDSITDPKELKVAQKPIFISECEHSSQ